MIRVVVFDCGGVVLRSGDMSPYGNWEQRLGLNEGELARRLWEGETWLLAERGEITEEELWQHVGCEIGLTDAVTLQELRSDIWSTWKINEQVLALIDRIRPHYRVGMLSNATDALEALLETRYGIIDRFDPIVNSARVGIAKPAEGIYRYLLEVLGVQAHEVVFIDDRAENIAAAAQLGIHVIWYVHADELERQLAAYLRLNGADTVAASATRPAQKTNPQEAPDPAPSIAQVR